MKKEPRISARTAGRKLMTRFLAFCRGLERKQLASDWRRGLSGSFNNTLFQAAVSEASWLRQPVVAPESLRSPAPLRQVEAQRERSEKPIPEDRNCLKPGRRVRHAEISTHSGLKPDQFTPPNSWEPGHRIVLYEGSKVRILRPGHTQPIWLSRGKQYEKSGCIGESPNSFLNSARQ